MKFHEKIYESFPYQSRVKLGERIFTSFNNSQYKRANAEIKQTRDLMDHPGLPYLEAGNPLNPTLLFIHGFGDTKESYLRQALAFRKDFHVIVPDMPGFGPNPRLKDMQYTGPLMADIVIQFMNQLNLKEVHIIGNSMGGAISSFVATKAPDRIKSLTLIDSAGFYFDHVHSVLDEFMDGRNLFLVSNPEDYDSLLSRVFTKVPYIPRPVFEFLFEKIRNERRWFEKMVSDLTHGFESVEDGKDSGFLLNDHVTDLSMPLHMIWGDSDSLFPVQTAHEIKKLIPHATLDVIENCGHAPQYEKTKEFNKKLGESLFK